MSDFGNCSYHRALGQVPYDYWIRGPLRPYGYDQVTCQRPAYGELRS